MNKNHRGRTGANSDGWPTVMVTHKASRMAIAVWWRVAMPQALETNGTAKILKNLG